MWKTLCVAQLLVLSAAAKLPPVIGSDTTYNVKPRQNLSRLAEQNGLALEHLAFANKLPVELEARKKQKTVEIKEIKLRPMIDDHDYDVKMRAMLRFFEEGDKVKITLRYRGREMAHQEIGTKLLDKVKAAVADVAKVEQDAKFEGRQVVMVLAPR